MKTMHDETKTMEEYETLCSDSAENCKIIIDWIFSGQAFIKSTVSDGFSHGPVSWLEKGRVYGRKKPVQDVLLTDVEDIIRGIVAGVVEFRSTKDQWYQKWSIAGVFNEQRIELRLKDGFEYRIKPGHTLPLKKVKKLVDRTPEDFWPLIGKWWCRHKDHLGRRFLIQADNLQAQEGYEIAPLGNEDWEPMQKTVECDV
jgi:hypothetical protein